MSSPSSPFECCMGQMQQINVIAWAIYVHFRWGFKSGISVKYYAGVLNIKLAGWW